MRAASPTGCAETSDTPLSGGTSGYEFLARYETAVRAIAKQHDPDVTVAVFSHCAAIRVYTALAAELDPGVSTELRIMNTGMSLLVGNPETRWSLAMAQ